MRHYSIRTEETYVSWIKRVILFHGKRHPLEMGEDEITRFLSTLAVHGQVSASTQNPALCALVFLYRLHASVLQRAVKEGVRNRGLTKPASCHTLRQAFATPLREDGDDIRTIQELLGYQDVKTMMIYTPVLNRGGQGVYSPMDRL